MYSTNGLYFCTTKFLGDKMLSGLGGGGCFWDFFCNFVSLFGKKFLFILMYKPSFLFFVYYTKIEIINVPILIKTLKDLIKLPSNIVIV